MNNRSNIKSAVFNARVAGNLLLTLLLLVFLNFISCGYSRNFSPAEPHWKDADDKDIADPGTRDPLLEWETADRTVFDQTEQFFDLPRSYGKISGNRKQALNINSYDEVPNSSWYTNRHFLFPMTVEEIKQGVAQTPGPDTSGSWIIWKPKVQGVTPGLFIKDKNGDRFILKFDPPGHPDMATSAAAITSRFFHAMGYNVPQETIIYWRPDILKIKEGLMFEDHSGVRRLFTEDDLNKVLKRVHYEEDGTIRSLASKFLPNVRGPFSFDGRRTNDPNDWCPHEHRRELRGLYVFCSFVNHWDIKDQNTMDILAEENDRKFLKHCLLDFGSTLGSAGHSPQSSTNGYCNQFDLRDALVSIFTLGIKKWQWEDARPYEYASVGYFESEIFHPDKWDPIYPIPAFEEMTHRDAYWAAKQVMALRDEHIRALVEAGEIRDKKASAYLIKTLIERRDKIGRYWFSKINPIDNFVFTGGDNTIDIDFDDLWLKNGLAGEKPYYRYEIRYRGKKLIKSENSYRQTIHLSPEDIEKMTTAFNDRTNHKKNEDFLFEINIKTYRGNHESEPTGLWLWYHPETGKFRMVGIEHLD